MEIGGIDIVIPHDRKEGFTTAICIIQDHWPNAVFEEAGENEIFVYKDACSKTIWDVDLGVPNTMIHVLGQQGVVTLVVDEINAEMDEIVSRIKSALDFNTQKEKENE